MKGSSVLLIALLGALLVAGSAAGPIKAVAEPNKAETQYVFVKLLFEGHDQPNFDRWHANATAATVAQVAGVPVNYLIRMVDGKIPGTDKSAPTPPPKKEDTFKPAPMPVDPIQAPATAAPVPMTTTPGPAPAAATPAPAAATPAPAPAAAGPTVTLITGPNAKPAEPEPKAVQTKPESGEGEITAPQQQQQQQQQQQEQQPARRSSGFWNSVQQALASSSAAQQQQQQQLVQTQQPEIEPAEIPVDNRPSRGTGPRVFVIGGRKLMGVQQLNPNQAMVEYAIKTNASEPWAVRETVKRKLMASAAGFGVAQGTSLRGFYTILKEHGVGYYPAMWVDGEQILSGNVALDAPLNRFINGTANKNFQHKLYKHSDLVKPKTPVAKNATNVTISEPAFIMANRSTTTKETVINTAAPQKSGLPKWGAALIAIGAITVAIALAGTVWRCVRERRKRQEEDEAAHSEPLSPHSVQ